MYQKESCLDLEHLESTSFSSTALSDDKRCPYPDLGNGEKKIGDSNNILLRRSRVGKPSDWVLKIPRYETLKLPGAQHNTPYLHIEYSHSEVGKVLAYIIFIASTTTLST